LVINPAWGGSWRWEGEANCWKTGKEELTLNRLRENEVYIDPLALAEVTHPKIIDVDELARNLQSWLVEASSISSIVNFKSLVSSSGGFNYKTVLGSFDWDNDIEMVLPQSKTVKLLVEGQGWRGLGLSVLGDNHGVLVNQQLSSFYNFS
jgi:hypothetical protein